MQDDKPCFKGDFIFKKGLIRDHVRMLGHLFVAPEEDSQLQLAEEDAEEQQFAGWPFQTDLLHGSKTLEESNPGNHNSNTTSTLCRQMKGHILASFSETQCSVPKKISETSQLWRTHGFNKQNDAETCHRTKGQKH